MSDAISKINGFCASAGNIAGKLAAFLLRNRTAVLLCLAVLLLLVSYIAVPSGAGVEVEARKMEKKIHNRQEILEGYVNQALERPVDEWLQFEDFPADMVIYRYNADTLQSWVNQFPVANDEVDVLTLWYGINHLNSRSLYNAPLAYLTEQEQYVNLGAAWYVVKVYRKGGVKVISGLLIKTEYLSNNTILASKINPELGFKKRISLSPVTFDEGVVVYGAGGGPLFSVSNDVTAFNGGVTVSLKWLALLLFCAALYSFLYNRRNFKSLLVYVLGLTFVRYLCFGLGTSLRYDYQMFSPNLYADAGIFSSFGNFLLNNLYVTLLVIGLYLLRKGILIHIKRVGKWDRRAICLGLGTVPVLLLVYINFVFGSLIYNSNIVLELYRLEELSVYSILAYTSYAMLFAVLYLSLQLFIPILPFVKKSTILRPKYIMVYICAISCYTLVIVSDMGFKKEVNGSKVWANKLAVERDISLELQLRSIEPKLVSDPIVGAMLSLPQERYNLIQNRMEELYLKGVSQKYEIKITICRPNDMLLDSKWQQMVDCSAYYQELLMGGVPLAPGSNFFFLNNYNGRVSYLGVLHYNSVLNGSITMYIEFESRYTKDITGYTAVLFDYKPSDNVNMPRAYSYAKYMDNRLVIYKGNYVYPMVSAPDNYKPGFSVVKDNKYLHFVTRAENDNLIIITREKRSIFPYLVSFSYLMLFYTGVLMLSVRGRKFHKRSLRIKLPKNSFRRKITYLITISLVVSLIFMGFGSVWFCLNYYRESNKAQMEERLQTVQQTLSDLCKYSQSYNEINTSTVFQALERIAKNTQATINLYDPHGRLIRSTQPELFDRYLLASRIHPDAYCQLVKERKMQVITREKLGELDYSSLYAPIYNADGTLVAIANIPYFAKEYDLTGDISTILAAIINVFILLLLAAIFGGTALANQLAKPLAEIGSMMKRIDVSKKTEHINYKNNDELGELVGAYNKMVDDLEESTQRLAQTEREQAWSEMARQIAHEIKNPLTPMRLSIQHLIRLKQRGIDGWEEKFEDVATSILEQIDILSNTASEFSSFAKFYYEENSVIDLAELINDQRVFFDTRDNIRIAYDYCHRDCNVFARKGQIIRVLVNLVSNAIQALEDGGGYIRITLREDERSYIVAIDDNGPGVKEEDTNKLFKPNFTTKSSGTGLGLAICRNIIEQSGGKISYTRSELGGACFAFSLPKYI
jgi:signal transduction histidine kinase